MSAPFDPSRPCGPRRPPPPEGMSDVERLLAYEEIRQLAARYALAMDSRDLDALVALFVDTVGHWDGRVGREPLKEGFEWSFRAGMAGRMSFVHVGNHVINLIDADTANGTVYCFAELGDRDREDDWLRAAIVYEDTYARRDGSWYFAARDHRIFYESQVELRPIKERPADWPKEIVGLQTVPEAWPTWQAFVAGNDEKQA